MTSCRTTIETSITNRILAALPNEEFLRLIPTLEYVPLARGDVLYDMGERIRYAYFLNKNTLVSVVFTMENGTGVEVCAVGGEGLVSIQSFLRPGDYPGRIVVLVAGGAMRIRADVLNAEFKRGGVLQDLLLHYTQAILTQIAQTAACNHIHSVEQRLARWLLTIHDRVAGEIPLTHEFISRRLGVHRSSVGETAGVLQREGVIRCRRGWITILDHQRLNSLSCECYAIIEDQFEPALRIKFRD